MFSKVKGAALFSPNFANVKPPAHKRMKMSGAALIKMDALDLLSPSGNDIGLIVSMEIKV